jgi:hypothetical protein
MRAGLNVVFWNQLSRPSIRRATKAGQDLNDCPKELVTPQVARLVGALQNMVAVLVIVLAKHA